MIREYVGIIICEKFYQKINELSFCFLNYITFDQVMFTRVHAEW
jgi:hypothetical protein